MNNEHHENGALIKSVYFHCSCVPLRCGHMLRLVYGANRASVSAQALACGEHSQSFACVTPSTISFRLAFSERNYRTERDATGYSVEARRINVLEAKIGIPSRLKQPQ